MSEPERYHGSITPMDLSELALQECAHHIGPAFIYELHIHPQQQIEGMRLLHRISAYVQSNPFAPYINLVNDPSMARNEWFLCNTVTGTSMGSKGC